MFFENVHVRKYRSMVGICVVVVAVYGCFCTSLYGLTSLTKNDPYPVFSTLYDHSYLLGKELFLAEKAMWAEERGDRFRISINGFFQSANRGKSMICVPQPIVTTANPTPIFGNDKNVQLTALLDLEGRSAMIPLLYGNLPTGQTRGPLITAAINALYPDVPLPLNFEIDVDTEQMFGFFSLPSYYEKRGMRIDLELDIYCDFGIHVQGGFSAIRQVAKPPINLTCQSTDPCLLQPGGTGSDTNLPTVSNPATLTINEVDKVLMNEFECIMREIGINIDTFQKTSIDEIRVQLFWRHAFPLNTARPDWPQMHIIPFIEGGASFSPGSERNTSELYGLPFGNNKHYAAGFTTGVDLNFIGTIEIGGAFGYTYFFDRDFDCFRLPNSKLQHNLFPFTTTVNVQPGHNLHFEGSIMARHFLDKLSMFFQYINLEHKHDCITVLNGDPAFIPDALAKNSGFKVKLANVGFNYDFTPNFAVGFLWQAPLDQRNAYRSTTVMFGVSWVF